MNHSQEFHVPELSDPVSIPINEVLAAANILARLDRLLAEPGNPVAEQLIGLGLHGQNDHLPRVADLPAGSPVTDEATARDYVRAVFERLHGRQTFLEQLSDSP